MASLSNLNLINPVLKTLKTRNMSFLLAQTTVGLGLSVVLTQTALAATFNMPQGSDSLIDNNNGQPLYITAKREESLIDIAMQYLLGQEEVVRANKGVDRWLPGDGAKVRIPSSYLLPDAPRQGVVINLPEYRLYYYPPAPARAALPVVKKSPLKKPQLNQPPSLDIPEIPVAPSPAPVQRKVISYSVGIGRVDWKTPLGVTKVVGKVTNPTWTPPPSIRAEHLAKGDVLPEVWPAGPDNPLGLFAFRLGIPGYLLHSTNKPQGVGMQVSHGCMRLYPKDIEQMFPMLPVGTPVNIVNQPVKVGWSNGLLYIESHPNLEGEETSYQQRLDIALNLIDKVSSVPVRVNGAALKMALEESNGLPTVISSNEAPTESPESAPPLSPPALELAPSATEKPVSAPRLSPPVLESSVPPASKKSGPPTLDPDPVVPRSEIERELRQEELQEREFRNSPFPRY